MQKKFLNNSITHIGLLVICFGIFGLGTAVLGINAPLHGGPFQDVTNNLVYNTGDIRGQSKTGKLIIGGTSISNTANMFLEVIGKIKIIPQAPAAGLSSGYGTFPALQVLGTGYSHDIIIGGGDASSGALPDYSASNVIPTLVPDANTSLDVRGMIKLDPTATGINFANKGYWYIDPVTGTVSTTEKPLCVADGATSLDGMFILCP